MQKVLTAQQMRSWDQYTTEQLFMPQDLLIERAAICVVQFLQFCHYRSALFVCGAGNNGADGIAAARIMLELNLSSTVYLVTKETSLNPNAKIELQRYLSKGGHLCKHLTDHYDIIVDAVFGIGLNREVKGCFKDTILTMNRLHNEKTPIVSIDIASGIHSDTGRIMSVAVEADDTVVLSAYKLGNLIADGKFACGTCHLYQTGIETGDFLEKETAFCFDQEEYRTFLKRDPKGNKSTFGKILHVTGNDSTGGASVLAASAGLHSGCGLCYIITDEANRNAVLSNIPEAIPVCYKTDEAQISGINKTSEEYVTHYLSGHYDSILIGCGIGTGSSGYYLLHSVITETNAPLILDADALNLLATHEELLEIIRTRQSGSVILTPHPLELSRLLHIPYNEMMEHYQELIMTYARENHVIIIGKNAVSVVTDGERYFINTSGNDGMATAGSGDVLAGITASLAATDGDLFLKACLSCHIHGLAGDKLANQYNSYYLTAKNLIDGLGFVL